MQDALDCSQASMYDQHAMDTLKEAYIGLILSHEPVMAASACRRAHS